MLLRDAIVTIIGRFGLALLLFATDVAIARLLLPSAKGRFTVVLLYSQLAALVLGIGLDNAMGYLAGRSREAARRGMANALLWTLVVGGMGLVGSIWLYGLPDDPRPTGPLTEILPGLTGSQFLFAALAIPGELLFGIGLLAILGSGRVGAYNGLRILRRTVLLLLIVATAAIARVSLDVALVLNLLALAVSVAAIILAAANLELLAGRPDLGVFREQLSFGTRSVLGSLAERLQFRADIFLVNLYLGVFFTGIYSVASGLAETLWYLPNALGMVVFSRAVDPSADAGRVAATMARTTLVVTAFLAVPVFVFAPWFITLVYGPRFAAAADPFRALLPGVVAYSVVAILSRYVVGRGNPGLGTAVLLAGLSVNVLLNIFLIPRIGVTGAAAASSVSYFVTAAFIVTAFRRVSGIGLRQTLIIQRSDLRAPTQLLRGGLASLGLSSEGGRRPLRSLRGDEAAAELAVEEHEPGEER
jgi:O-antigen/teichoic acid export membrane protein